MWFGPYDSLSPGAYRVTFFMNVTGAGEEPVALLDINAKGEDGTIAQKGVAPTDGWEKVTVNFTLNRYQPDVEFRGFRMAEEGTIKIKSISLTQDTSADPTSDSVQSPKRDTADASSTERVVACTSPTRQTARGRYGTDPLTLSSSPVHSGCKLLR